MCYFLHPPVTSSILGSNILLSNLFSNNISVCSFPNERNQLSHITGIIIGRCTLPKAAYLLHDLP